jgi:Tfp pilus assembly protein PilZ
MEQSTEQTIENKRRYPRYETDARLQFRVPYDFKAEVDFKITEEMIEGRDSTYIGFSKNISVHGLSFECSKRLEMGDLLWLDLHLPKSDQVVFMQGEVCWCKPLESSMEGQSRFQAGVQIAKVDGLDVEQTVYFDKTYGVVWSELLERVLGGFAKINRNKKS